MNVLRERKETDVAPRAEMAPTPDCLVRHAYSSVPQKTNLKRRWRMPGSNAVATEDAANSGDPKKVKREISSPTPIEEDTQSPVTPSSSKSKSGKKKEKKEKKSKSEKKSDKKVKKEKKTKSSQ
jgi:Mg-chelatase subunit ChlI